MPRPVSSPSAVRLTTEPLPRISTDLLVVPLFEGEAAAAVQGLDEATAGELKRAAAAGEVTGRLYDLFLTPAASSNWHAGRVAVFEQRDLLHQ